MTITEEEIMAYVDGEMDEAARGRVTLAALADPELAERIAAQRALRERLQAHFAPLAAAPVPDAWVEQIRQGAPSAQVIDLAAARAQRAARNDRPPARYRAWIGGAVAAVLAIAVFAGPWRPATDQQPIVARGGVLVATGALGQALDTQLAATQGEAPIRMLGTFHRAGGGLCRVFAGPQASGVACRAGDQWQLQHVLPGSAAPTTAYRQAGSGDAELMGLAQAMAEGAPLDAAQEQAAKAKGWR
jgi:sugar/nucleoside kinase (ribokinase family)